MSQAPVSTPSSSIDLTDVQGDVILGIPKRKEHFVFFTIAQVAQFKSVVGSQAFIKLITSTADIQNFRNQIQQQKGKLQGKPAPLIPFAAVNIAFTQSGLTLVGLKDDIGDPSFKAGQLAQARNLGDSGTTDSQGNFDPAWFSVFKNDIHGVILIAGDSDISVKHTEEKVLKLFDCTITQVFNVSASARPGAEKGHEHFGYKDGISSPAVKGIVSPLPGQQVVDPGVILLSQPGDPQITARPPWAKNGSFLVYRHLDQLVPEFDKFKHDNPLHPLELGIEKGAELLGARLFGRWKSGAPIDITPTQDDPVLAADPQRNNNFDFSNPTDQSHCPFAAHIRKTNPRSDLGAAIVAPHAINRTGLPFGPEVTDAERASNTTQFERGLAFVCYQSTLARGFEFLQISWADNIGFIFGKTVNGLPFNPGFDPIIGQNGGDPKGREMGGFDPSAQGNNVNLPIEFVVSKGGAYFFSPAISVLQKQIGTPSP